MTTAAMHGKTGQGGEATAGKHSRAADKQFAPDWWLFIVTLVLLGFGVVMVFNASYAFASEVEYTGYDPLFFLKRQAVAAVVGMIGLFVLMRVSYWKLRRVAVAGMVATIALLAVVLVMGHWAQGAQRWLKFGPFQLQPSEMAKLALVLYLSHALAANPGLMRNLWRGVVPLLMGVLIFVVLPVELQPDLGTAITLVLTLVLLLFTAGAKTRWVATIVAILAVCGFGLALRSQDRWERVTTFVNPSADPQNAGYQIQHSQIALGTGGLTGVGFGESREKLRGNLPAQRTDFIFAIVGEELGLAGTCGVLAVFLVFAARGFHIASRTKNRFGQLLATGITGMISVQALINISVVTASLPATGVPLPFLSFGGSSLVTTLLGVGILLNVSRHPYHVDEERSQRRRRNPGKERARAREMRAWEA